MGFKGTPGVWVVKSWINDFAVIDQNENMLSRVGNGRDAVLMAAAPELLEALQFITSSLKSTLKIGYDRITELGGSCDSPEMMIKRDASIIKAEKAIQKALRG